ncbi:MULTISPECIES: hypothetical protein [Dactylosporangium]|uniref:Uncharacterized protein n=2 Tax=Dactylosporangium TaxID=35753 RepID=A0A9W6NS23_9ACTN|nr:MULTISPECIES: hypothetical protein [Dactylosporangium]UAB92909.1 hypothetical protein Dvina_31945 [Dactylosporangium vinaceum]UWZ41332.1 hypothetical protein Dmats_27050 [Dactylosporangium matsuzakiense]GLL07885.1 hypothetical protein GCM10017581_096440 [Dactylosporangium matsuzakiense]
MPIDELSELARALVGERLNGRDVVPAHVRDRLVALAGRWAAHGFTAQTVADWVDLEPEAAALLVAAGAGPAELRRQVVTTPEGEMSLWQAVVSGALSAQQAADRLPAAKTPEPPAAPRVAPAVFSHPPDASERDATDQRSRSRPQGTPFQS